MLSINGLHNFYYLPHLHDMRCKAPRIFEIIRAKYHRDPLNGDVYIFMSKDQRKVKMVRKCPKFEVIANLEVESVVNTFAVIIHLKLSHYGNDRLRKRV